MKTKRSLIYYSNAEGRNLMNERFGGIYATGVNACQPNTRRKCVAETGYHHPDCKGVCRFFFSESSISKRIELGKILHKSPSRLSEKDMDERAEKIEIEEFKKCRRIRVTVERA